MKKLGILLVFLALLLCSCLPDGFVLPGMQTTIDETTQAPTSEITEAVDQTTPEDTNPEDTLPAHEHLYANETIVKEATCTEAGTKKVSCECGEFELIEIPATGEHTYGDAVTTKAATCTKAGEQTATCSVCGDQKVTPVSATGVHIYLNAVCMGCGTSPISVYEMPSAYDADGDGKKDTYNFSKDLLDGYQNGVHVWAGDYDTTLSNTPNHTSAGGYEHWYTEEGSKQSLVYKITVSEAGVYEMILHFRMKDDQERGSKYTINGGTANEQILYVSYGYSGMNVSQYRDNNTLTTYMYGITINLVAGENIIKIEHAADSPKSQHYRDLYFVKVGEYHPHSFVDETIVTQETCSTPGEKIVTCVCGKSETIIIPATYDHTYVNDVCTVCGKVYVAMGIVEYNFLYDTPGFAGGTILFMPEAAGIYTFYWGTNSQAKLADHTMLYSGTFNANVENELIIQSFTAIPKGATYLLAMNGDETVVYSYKLPASRLLTQEELYVFGAISDTHQGTRYGSTSIPYNHFVNAAKVLYEKGAIAIGICGDFSYNNTEDEYILHEKAIKEIYQFAPDMPIFTTSGNHESKYTGFSYDWYMQYSRDVVDYDSDIDYKYFDGNELDYVVELPDGSVMIYFHQIAYDYGSSTSRLVSDEQLVWLEARLEQYKDQTVFFFFHTFMDEMVGDASTPGNEYGLPMISSTVEYKKFTELFTKYTNVVYFSGHSHWTFDSQFVTPKPGKTNDDKNIDDKDGTFATMVHIPACSTPRTLVGSGKGRSEGYIVRVYETCIILEGYEFVQGETFAYATYIIEK